MAQAGPFRVRFSAASAAKGPSLELAAGAGESPQATRLAVEGCTPEDPERHFLGWEGDVEPDELFASGAAWGIRIVRRPV